VVRIVNASRVVPGDYGTGRIIASVPTLKALSDAGAKVVVTAHLGRPKGGPDPKFSLAPVAAALAAQLGRHVQLAGDVVGTDALARAEGLTDGDILLLENIRFDPRETSKDDTERLALARALVELVGDDGAFVSDGFKTWDNFLVLNALMPVIRSYQELLMVLGFLLFLHLKA
jgi:phosphoglycerate kinase